MRAALGLALASQLWLSCAAGAQTAPSSAQRETRTVAGLKAPGRIVVDHWGVAHIYGADARDAFFLQGYNAARDRLWQIDLWRKRGLGRLSASFGPAYVEKDRAARLFLYRGDMAAEWAAYPPEARGWTQAFVEGINSYVAEVRAGARPKPAEFSLTNSEPETWAAEDVVRIRSAALVGNLTAEVLRSRSICLGGLPFETLRHAIEPPHDIRPVRGLEPCGVPADVLKTYLLATTPVSFLGESLAKAQDPLPALAGRQEEIVSEGSNNWVLSAAKSLTGRPILANDPHREHSVPSLRYVVDVMAPDLHLAGAGEPALPGVSFGHNDTVAWGLTIFYADQQDLYVYDLSADHPDAYRYQGRWEPMTVVREAIPVKGQADRSVLLKFTRHGPVIAEEEPSGRAFAVRSIWSEPGAAAYFNAAWLFRARRWADFETAHAHWGAPPLNLVYADTAGDIGWLASAFAPVRPNWDGLTPVPGDGRYEWRGLTGPELFPSLRNPAKGWLATANEMNLPPGYPADLRKLGFEWVDRSRIDEIDSVLGSKDRFSLYDMMRLQTDVSSPLARRASGLLTGLHGQDEDERRGLLLLKDWDGSETVDSAQAALFEVWSSGFLRQAAVQALVPAAARPAFAEPQLAAVVDWLSRPSPAFGPDPAATRDAVLLRSLGSAWRRTAGLLGPDPARWRWGDLHHAEWSEAVGVLASPAFRAQLSVGPLEVGGSASTPMATTFRGGDFTAVAGASVRIVLDVGAWDNSVFINSPGQSGDPLSPHYRDLFPLWAGGRYAPFLYSPSAVLANAERVIDLEPAR